MRREGKKQTHTHHALIHTHELKAWKMVLLLALGVFLLSRTDRSGRLPRAECRTSISVSTYGPMGLQSWTLWTNEAPESEQIPKALVRAANREDVYAHLVVITSCSEITIETNASTYQPRTLSLTHPGYLEAMQA